MGHRQSRNSSSGKPALPHALNDRACDNWEPLLAIADLAGGEWAGKARDTAKALSGDEVAADDDDGVELLHDIRAVFDATIDDVIFTKLMIAHLVADSERQWAAYGRAHQPITDRQVAKLLSPFGIISGTVRLGDATAKGYRRSAFAEAWSRYPKACPEPRQNVSPASLDDFQPSQRHNADETGASDLFSSVTEPARDAREKHELSNNDGFCDVVTDCSHEEEVAWTL